MEQLRILAGCSSSEEFLVVLERELELAQHQQSVVVVDLASSSSSGHGLALTVVGERFLLPRLAQIS